MDLRRPLFRTVFIASVLATPGCGLILDLTPTETAAEPRPFLCQAEIFREVGSELTEQWQAWVFAADEFAGDAMCRLKLEEYKTRSLAPGFVWQTRNFRMTEGGPSNADPLLRKEAASECAFDGTGPPFTAGGPAGADVVLENPSPGEALVSVLATTSRGVFFADPAVKLVVWRLAERQGYPSAFAPFEYQRLERHLRMSDLFVEVQTPFMLGDVRIDKLYIQAVGTVYATRTLSRNEWFIESGPRAKFFFYGRGRFDDDTEVASFCFAARGAPPLYAAQGSTSPGFGFSTTLTSSDLEGLPLTVSLGIGAAPTFPVPGDRYQPFVALSDRETSAFDVQLGGAAGDVFHDLDGDLSRILWFTDFETATERYLGEGLPLNVGLAPGEHEITAVAYDARGAYNVDTATVRVLPPAAADDAYSTDEDTPLVVAAPGVLTNDTDAGVPRTAQLVTGPSHGLLALNADGSFVYTPDPNFFGIDGFTYQVDHNGLAVAGPAVVTITVVELSPQEELDRIGDICEVLLASGALSPGQANSCLGMLDAARADVDRGAIGAACNTLQAFINHVNSLVRGGVLTPEEAQPLLDRANNLRDELGCGAMADPPDLATDQ